MRKIWSSEMHAQNLGWRPAGYVIFRKTTETNDRCIVPECSKNAPGSAFGMVTQKVGTRGVSRELHVSVQ